MKVNELEVLTAAAAAVKVAANGAGPKDKVTVGQGDIAQHVDGRPPARAISRQVVELAKRGHLKATKSGPGPRDPKRYSVTAKGQRILAA